MDADFLIIRRGLIKSNNATRLMGTGVKYLVDEVLDHAITLARRSFQSGAIENLHAPAAVLNQPFLQKLASGQSDAVTLMAQHIRNVFLGNVEAF
jgi:hypothetical protein